MSISFTALFSIALGAILVENYLLVQFLGICSFLGVSQKTETALGMSMAVIFVMTLSSTITWMVNEWLLLPYGLGYMQTVAFILVIASLVQLVELFLKKAIPSLHAALGIYLPLITTNCAVLGCALLNARNGYTLIESVTNGFAAGVGFTLAILLFSSIRERLRFSDYPESFEGFPIALVSASLLAMAFMGFAGLQVF